jgi:chemotaxis protein CheD
VNISYNTRFQLELVTIFPGEFHATGQERVIYTLLGSCITVVLYDSAKKVGGMNHFMLPDTIDKERFYLSKSGKYGMYAMELLINELIKLGGIKKNFQAKVFGGGSVLGSGVGHVSQVPENNIRFAFAFLEQENIPVIASNVGGKEARKVYFFTKESRILLKKISKSQSAPIASEESAYFNKIRAKKEVKKEQLTFF